MDDHDLATAVDPLPSCPSLMRDPSPGSRQARPVLLKLSQTFFRGLMGWICGVDALSAPWSGPEMHTGHGDASRHL